MSTIHEVIEAGYARFIAPQFAQLEEMFAGARISTTIEVEVGPDRVAEFVAFARLAEELSYDGTGAHVATGHRRAGLQLVMRYRGPLPGDDLLGDLLARASRNQQPALPAESRSRWNRNT
jgi:hypothetical protein